MTTDSPKMVRVEIEASLHDLDGEPVSFVAEWASAILAQVPAEYRDRCRMEYADGLLDIAYNRPETDAEKAAREERRMIAAQREEARERAELARLQQKYGR